MERYTRPKAVAGVEYVVYHLDMPVDYVVVVGGSRLREDSGELGLLRESLKRFWSDTQGS